jgi:hypothetical protein
MEWSNYGVVQFEKRFVSGHRFSGANKGGWTSGFSRWGLRRLGCWIKDEDKKTETKKRPQRAAGAL